MSCADNEYFTKTYVPYPLKFAPNANFVLSDVKDMKATLEHVQDRSICKHWIMSSGEIITVNGIRTVLIESTHITKKGAYDWRLVMTDQNDKERGLCLYPSRIIFR